MKWFVNWINRNWTHNRDKDGDFGIRAFIHIWVGVIISLLVLVHPVLSLVMAYLFYKYQRNEDVHTIDEAWKDIYGALIGVPVGGLIVWLI